MTVDRTVPGMDQSLSENATDAMSNKQDGLLEATSAASKGFSDQYITHLNVPSRARSPDTLSLVSAEDFTELHLYEAGSRSHHVVPSPTISEANEKLPSSWKARYTARLRKSWIRNKGLVFVLIAQVFATLMGATTRRLEQDDNDVKGMHPFQILFARMTITLLLCVSYMWYTKVEHFPFGHPSIRWHLAARGFGGFFGVFGLYYSLMYLSLSDAIVLTFLAPSLTCWICSKIINEPFTRAEKIGGAISLVGVVLVARPSFIFSALLQHNASPDVGLPSNGTASEAPLVARSDQRNVTPAQRLSAVGMAMLGVVGSAVAYTMIRWIGRRAHPLISVNYFAFWCTLVSAFFLLFVPAIPFRLPANALQWSLLIVIGFVGFANQFLLTAGLRYEKSSRATNMTFTSMVFAMLFDFAFWGIVPGPMDLVGSGLIVGSALVVAMQKQKTKESGSVELERADRATDVERDGNVAREEADGLLDGREVDEDDDFGSRPTNAQGR